MWKWLQKKQGVSVKDRLLIENGASPDLTFVFEQSAWGGKWNDPVNNNFDGLRDINKHVTSLGVLSMKGFVKARFPHCAHFLPKKRGDDWFEQLVRSLTSFENGIMGYVRWRKLMEYSYDNFSCMKIKSTERRVNGQLLLDLLIKMMPSVEEEDLTLSSVYLTVFSFVSQEKGRYEDEEFIMDNRNLKWPLKGKCLRNEDGSTDRDDFGAADLVERLLVHFCIMNCSKMSTNRLEFIPEILKHIGGENKIKRMCRILLAVTADIFQCTYALSTDKERLRKLLGTENQGFELTDQNILLLRKRLDCLLECIIPAYGYLAFCLKVEGQNALEFVEIRDLVVKAQIGKRVVIKNTKRYLKGLIPCTKTKDVLLDLESSGFEHEPSNQTWIKKMQTGGNSEGPINPRVNEDLFLRMHALVKLTVKEYEDTQVEEMRGDLSDNELFHSMIRDWNVVKDTTCELVTVTEEVEEIGTLLLFMGSLNWLDSDAIEIDTSDNQTAVDESLLSGQDMNAHDDEYVQLTDEEKQRMWTILQESEDDDEDNSKNDSQTVLNTPVSEPEGIEETLSSTKIDAPLARRNIFADLSMVSNGRESSSSIDESNETENEKTISKDNKTKLDRIFRMGGKELSPANQDIMSKYTTEAPLDVPYNRWSKALEITLQAIVDDKFGNIKIFEERFFIAIATAKVVCRITADYLKRQENIDESEMRTIINEEAVLIPVAFKKGKPSTLKDKIKAQTRISFLTELLELGLEDEDRITTNLQTLLKACGGSSMEVKKD